MRFNSDYHITASDLSDLGFSDTSIAKLEPCGQIQRNGQKVNVYHTKNLAFFAWYRTEAQ